MGLEKLTKGEGVGRLGGWELEMEVGAGMGN